MDIPAFEKLRDQQVISDADLEKMKAFQQSQPLSVHWDLRTLLYFGIFLLATGLGIIVYENIDTIGHDIIIAIITLCCAACFFYCIKKSISLFILIYFIPTYVIFFIYWYIS